MHKGKTFVADLLEPVVSLDVVAFWEVVGSGGISGSGCFFGCGVFFGCGGNSVGGDFFGCGDILGSGGFFGCGVFFGSGGILGSGCFFGCGVFFGCGGNSVSGDFFGCGDILGSGGFFGCGCIFGSRGFLMLRILLGLLLNIPGKTKDGVNARKDMVEMGIRDELAPQLTNGTKMYLLAACYTLSKAEKTIFCECLHGVKVPSGYYANIRKLVSMKDLKLLGMKAHDCHVIMTQMIPIAIRGVPLPRVRHTITKLCLFFNMIHSKVIDPEKLDEWHWDIILTLCQLEMYFPPSFFDVIVHLVSHIVGEIKSGSIVQGYASEEVVQFCTNYMDDVPDIGLPQPRHEGRLDGMWTIGHKDATPNDDDLEQAHFTLLQRILG
ncbi:hypothetical protein Tco_0099821 [Tanacetum coccineum]